MLTTMKVTAKNTLNQKVIQNFLTKQKLKMKTMKMKQKKTMKMKLQKKTQKKMTKILFLLVQLQKTLI